MSENGVPIEISAISTEIYSFYILIPCSIVTSCFVYFVIITKSKTLGNFKYYLLLKSFWVQLFEVLIIVNRPVYLCPYLAGFSGGILRNILTYNGSLYLLSFQYCAAGSSLMSVSCAAIYRFWFMFRPQYKYLMESKTGVTIFVVCHLLAYSCIFCFVVIISPPSSMLKELAQNSSETELNPFINEPSFYHFYELNGAIRFFYKVTFVILMITSVALLASIVYDIHFVLSNQKNTKSLTKAAKVLYVSSLVEVLLCVAFLNGPISVFVFSWGWNVPKTSKTVGVAISLVLFHGTLDRLSTLYCIVPYRKYCINVLGCFGNAWGNVLNPSSIRLVVIHPM